MFPGISVSQTSHIGTPHNWQIRVATTPGCCRQLRVCSPGLTPGFPPRTTGCGARRPAQAGHSRLPFSCGSAHKSQIATWQRRQEYIAGRLSWLTQLVTRRETTAAGGAIAPNIAAGFVADAGGLSGDGFAAAATAATAAAATAAAAGEMVGETTADTSRQKSIL